MNMPAPLLANSLLESIISNYLSVAVTGGVKRLQRGPDFEIRQSDGERLLIEVKATAPDAARIEKLRELVKSSGPAAEFVLVTPQPPTEEQKQQFDSVFRDVRITSTWIGVNELPALLGVAPAGDLLSPVTAVRLQTDALIGNVARYARAPVGPGDAAEFKKEVAPELLPLTRQFSYATVSRIAGESQPLETVLRIAQRTENVTVVFSDIVNFSSMVTASRPEDLRESMARYYRLARDVVFSHGGMLDKFIGDAVLAVFGYPFPGLNDASNAMHFASDLITIGKEVVASWQEDLNAVIPSGTRVGIASGDLWPVNIGVSGIEVSLLGDTINLAARLEKNCQPDHFLLDNRTHTKAVKENAKARVKTRVPNFFKFFCGSRVYRLARWNSFYPRRLLCRVNLDQPRFRFTVMQQNEHEDDNQCNNANDSKD
jgi:adenylate cyclase